MIEPRPPEAMPADWTVVFDGVVWNVGDWKPSRKEQSSNPSPMLPRPGEPVHVEWRRSVTGKNVPRLVRPRRPILRIS